MEQTDDVDHCGDAGRLPPRPDGTRTAGHGDADRQERGGGGMLTLEVGAIGGGAGGGRGGLWPHDRGEGALLFDCRNHMDRRE